MRANHGPSQGQYSSYRSNMDRLIPRGPYKIARVSNRSVSDAQADSQSETSLCHSVTESGNFEP